VLSVLTPVESELTEDETELMPVDVDVERSLTPVESELTEDETELMPEDVEVLRLLTPVESELTEDDTELMPVEVDIDSELMSVQRIWSLASPGEVTQTGSPTAATALLGSIATTDVTTGTAVAVQITPIALNRPHSNPVRAPFTARWRLSHAGTSSLARKYLAKVLRETRVLILPTALLLNAIRTAESATVSLRATAYK
jgi:hypothetical protein